MAAVKKRLKPSRNTTNQPTISACTHINTSENEIFENNSYLQRRNTVPTG
jgi:hypothetical protein